jgi:acyl-[acyl carrier protein]--UDP-N-acetylglucosamine O-acyltransferase
VAQIKNGYRALYKEGRRLEEALAEMRSMGNPEVDRLAEFVASSTRGFVR